MLDTADGATTQLRTAVIPMHGIAGDAASALLLFRVRPRDSDAQFEQTFLTTAQELSDRARDAITPAEH